MGLREEDLPASPKLKLGEWSAVTRARNGKRLNSFSPESSRSACANDMSKKKNRKDKKEEQGLKRNFFETVASETKQSIFVVVSFSFATIFLLAIMGKAGSAGATIARALDFGFGDAQIAIPILFFLLGGSAMFYIRPSFFAPTLIGGLLFLVSILGGIDVIFGDMTAGYAGFIVALPFIKLFDFWASLVILGSLFIVSFLLILNTSFIVKREESDEDDTNAGKREENRLSSFMRLKNALQALRGGAKKEPQNIVEEGEKERVAHLNAVDTAKSSIEAETGKRHDADTQIAETAEDGSGITGVIKKSVFGKRMLGAYKMPPLDLLEYDRGKPSSGDIKANANIIKRTFKNFGIEVEMAEVNIGPSVTQYTLRPAEGVKLARIVSLQNDLALALAAHPLRIEAPIPGRSLVGIEIPNKAVALVGARSLLSNELFYHSKYALTLGLGRDVSGQPIYVALEKMPHLLIAGSTGSGKSVAIHALMMSLLYRNGPDNLRFMLVDPKRVELTVYSGIPHLLTPVITDAKKTILALKWVVSEMERRYQILSDAGARDIHSYQVTKEALSNPMPYIVVVIDELADIMAAYPRELEASIVRLAQMSRAVGIHLIVSTQRPSVEVITGLIKANITSRMAFQVASQVDSRTILDMAGAEKLLGNGDMLFLAGDTAKPKRIQGTFIHEQEVRRVTQFLENQHNESAESPSDYLAFQEEGSDEGKKTIFGGMEEFEDAGDELYPEAKRLVIEAKKASASYLQRRMRIGYARAARLIDILEEKGVVGPGEGAKPREVYGVSNDSDADVGTASGSSDNMVEEIHVPARKKKEKEGGYAEEPGEDFFNSVQ